MPTLDTRPARTTRSLGRRLLGSPLVGALTTPHPVDRYLELVRPSWSLSDVRAEVIAVKRTSRGSVTLILRPNATWQGFEAGQHVRVAVEIDGVRRSRRYSIACSARDAGNEIELTVRAHPEGEVSQYLNRRAEPGLVLGLSQAEGSFVLPASRPQRLLLIAGGSGITPLMSMLRTLHDEAHEGSVKLLYYSPTRADTIYAQELAELAASRLDLRLFHVHSREQGDGLTGYFGHEHLLAGAPDYADADVFACGPPALIDAVHTIWTGEAIGQRLRVEHFVPPATSVVDGEAQGNVQFARSRLQAHNDGNPLLDQAEAAGLTPEHGCRMGICHSCTCRKLSGGVRNLRTGAVSTEPDEEIQICISVPVGDVELDL